MKKQQFLSLCPWLCPLPPHILDPKNKHGALQDVSRCGVNIESSKAVDAVDSFFKGLSCFETNDPRGSSSQFSSQFLFFHSSSLSSNANFDTDDHDGGQHSIELYLMSYDGLYSRLHPDSGDMTRKNDEQSIPTLLCIKIDSMAFIMDHTQIMKIIYPYSKGQKHNRKAGGKGKEGSDPIVAYATLRMPAVDLRIYLDSGNYEQDLKELTDLIEILMSSLKPCHDINRVIQSLSSSSHDVNDVSPSVENKNNNTCGGNPLSTLKTKYKRWIQFVNYLSQYPISKHEWFDGTIDESCSLLSQSILTKSDALVISANVSKSLKSSDGSGVQKNMKKMCKLFPRQHLFQRSYQNASLGHYCRKNSSSGKIAIPDHCDALDNLEAEQFENLENTLHQIITPSPNHNTDGTKSTQKVKIESGLNALNDEMEKNNPIFLKVFQTLEEEEPLKFHYISHTALDIIEEKIASQKKSTSSQSSDMYLGLLFPTEVYKIYGYITNCETKLILITDETEVKDSVEIKQLLQKFHSLYVDTISNPFYSFDQTIQSKSFEGKVVATVNVFCQKFK